MKKKRLGNYVVGVVKDIEQSAGRPGFSGRLDRIAGKIAFIYRRDFFSMGAFIIIALGGASGLMWALVSSSRSSPSTCTSFRGGGSARAPTPPDP